MRQSGVPRHYGGVSESSQGCLVQKMMNADFDKRRGWNSPDTVLGRPSPHRPGIIKVLTGLDDTGVADISPYVALASRCARQAGYTIFLLKIRGAKRGSRDQGYMVFCRRQRHKGAQRCHNYTYSPTYSRHRRLNIGPPKASGKPLLYPTREASLRNQATLLRLHLPTTTIV